MTLRSGFQDIASYQNTRTVRRANVRRLCQPAFRSQSCLCKALRATLTASSNQPKSLSCLYHRYTTSRVIAKKVKHNIRAYRCGRVVTVAAALVVAALEVPMTSSDTVARPTGFVTPFRPSTISIAGPTLKKSTTMNVGARPYSLLHRLAEAPRFPVPPPGAFVVVIYEVLGY